MEEGARSVKFWIRIDVAITTDPNVWTLAKRLKIPFAQAVGHCILVWGQVAQHYPDGDLSALSEGEKGQKRAEKGVIDMWAMYERAPHRKTQPFSEVFWELFVTDDRIRGWHERQGALIDRAVAEQARHVRRKSACVVRKPASTERNGTEPTTKAIPANRGGWVGRFLTALTDVTKGSYPAGRLGRDLKDLIATNGEEPAYAAWLVFLAGPDRKYGPPYFAKNFVDYAGGAKPNGKNPGETPAEYQFRKRGYV